MLNLLQKKSVEEVIVGSEQNTLPRNDIQQIAEILSVAIKDLEIGKQPDLSGIPNELIEPIKGMADALSARNERDLEQTVGYSMQASESMAAVARITGEVRDASELTCVMSGAVEELTASIDQISLTATNAASEINTASDLMVEGREKVRKTSDAMTQIEQSMVETEKETSSVGSAVEKITSFIGTIDGIAQQTNLLALNATIEAARAGEAGKGFAVVAEEVKTLSGETQKATEQIGTLISNLRSVTENLSNCVEQARSSVTIANELTDETHRITSNASEVAANSSHKMSEIENVLKEQSLATKEISQGVSKIATVCEKAAGHAEEVISAVISSEKNVSQQFESLDKMEIPNYVLHRAKSDHFLWKKNLSEMMVGLNNLNENELSDHNSCRLGKWYNTVADQSIKQEVSFREIERPHAEVHASGKLAASLFAKGDREGAAMAIEDMEKASTRVVTLLNTLIQKSSQLDK